MIAPATTRRPHGSAARRGRRGFTLIEALVATALLGLSLIVMFGFHGQAVRANMHARKMTDCTYLAQTEMEQLLTLPWNDSYRHPDLEDDDDDPTTSGDEWAFLEHPAGVSTAPDPVNAAFSTDDTTYGELQYYLTWDVEDMQDSPDADALWARIRVRCMYRDEAFEVWRGTTIASYRYKD